MQIFVGIDCAENHHDVCVVNDHGRKLAGRRVPDGVAGVEAIHELVARYAETANDVTVGIELDRGLLVAALLGAATSW